MAALILAVDCAILYLIARGVSADTESAVRKVMREYTERAQKASGELRSAFEAKLDRLRDSLGGVIEGQNRSWRQAKSKSCEQERASA
jgi:hypothetical protein